MTTRQLGDVLTVHTFRGALVAALLACLAGCKQEVSVALYSSDVVKTLTSGETIKSTAVMLIELPTRDDCDEHNAAIVGILARYDPAVKSGKCLNEGVSTYLEVSGAVSLVMYKRDTQNPWEGLVAVFVAPALEDPTNVALYAIITSNLESIKREIGSLFTIGGDRDLEMTLKAVIQNDDRDELLVKFRDAFVDGKPVDRSIDAIPLSKRNSVTVEVSNVGGALFVQGAPVLLATMNLAD